MGRGSHVKFTCFVLLPISEEVKTLFPFFFLSMYNKAIIIIRIGLCDIQNNQGLGKGYQCQRSASAVNPCPNLDYSGYNENLIQ